MSEPTHVQSLLFDRAQWSDSEARSWAAAHGYRSEPVDTPEDGRYHHIRQEPPWHFKRHSFRTIDFGERDGIKAVIGHQARRRNSGDVSHRVPDVTIFLGWALDVVIETEDEELRWVLEFTPGAVAILAPDDAFERHAPGSRLYLVRDLRVDARPLDPGELDKAARAYELWTDDNHDAENVAELDVPNAFTDRIGRALRLGYRSDKFHDRGTFVDYEHDFEDPRPLVYFAPGSPEGYALVGGAFRVTPRGIED